MAKDWQIKKRRPVRRKNIAPLLKDLEAALGIDLAVDGAFLEMADYGPWKMVLVDRVPLAVELMSPDDERVVFLTLRGFLSYPCEKRFVEVDHGACKACDEHSRRFGTGSFNGVYRPPTPSFAAACSEKVLARPSEGIPRRGSESSGSMRDAYARGAGTGARAHPCRRFPAARRSSKTPCACTCSRRAPWRMTSARAAPRP